MDRRHAEQSTLAARRLEDAHLDGDRTGLDDVDRADQHEQERRVQRERTEGESRAEGISIVSPELDRALAPGAIISYQQNPFTERYSYYAGPTLSITFGRCASKFDYVEYIDRVERAEKFGYRIPAPPPGWVPVWSKPR